MGLNNLIANYFGQGFMALLGILAIPIVVSNLGVEAYGLVGLFAVAQAFSVLLDLGMAPTLSREFARYRAGIRPYHSILDLLRTFELIVLAAATVSLTLTALSAGAIASNWATNSSINTLSIQGSILLMAAVTAATVCSSLYRTALIGMQEQVTLNIIEVVFATVKFLGLILLFTTLNNRSVVVFFSWHLLVSILALITFRRQLFNSLPKSEYKGRFSASAVSDVRRFALGVVGTTLIGTLLSQFDKMLLSANLTLEQWGEYSIAFTISGSLVTFVTPINQTLIPLFTNAYALRDEDQLIYLYHLGTQLVVISAGSFALFALFFPDVVWALWTSNVPFSNASLFVLRLLIFGRLLNVIISIPYEVQLAAGWSSLSLLCNVTGAVFMIPLMMFAVPLYKELAASLLWTMLNIYYMIFMLHVMHKKLLVGQKYAWYLRDILKPLSAGTLLMTIATTVNTGTLSKVNSIVFMFLSIALTVLTMIVVSTTARKTLVLKLSSAMIRVKK